MIRVMIVEDEKPILELMKRLVSQHAGLEVVGAFTSPMDALSQYPFLLPDAVFLDVEMPRMGGIELAEKLKELNEDVQVVFTTAYPGYAVEAFRVNALDYLLKPVTPDTLKRVVAKLLKYRALHTARRPLAQADEVPFVQCLGTFETRGKDGALLNWPTRKTEELFAYLVAYPNRHAGKWRLTELLWPDLEEDRALHNLHNTVYRLKKTLKDARMDLELIHSNEGYLLQAGPGFSDLEQLRGFMDQKAEVDEQNAAAGVKLLRSCTGNLFGGKDYVWSLGLASVVSDQMASLCRMIAKFYAAAGDRTALKETMRTYLSVAHLDEEMTERLLRLYAEDGETNLFRVHYESYVKQLETELGLMPSNEIRELAARIMSM
ncbi:response regulator [Paenibacillus hamazuiensis]|uniref:response regulator n=1 Tax=Paenibacillus hamazuiensis TaxID=2936508 RepID=UPI00200F2085|nr:response regulator [Paenibacillus hamazuiensis]